MNMKKKRGMDKKGATRKFWIPFVIISGIIAILAILVSYYPEAVLIKPKAPVWLDNNPPNIDWGGPIGSALKFIFGITQEQAQSYSALIVLIIVWGIFFIMFSDGINKFGFFEHKELGWLIGAGMAVILANLNFYYNLLVNVMAIFTIFAAFASIAALVSIFIAMFAVYWGVSSLGPWIMKRKAMHLASQADAGGTQIAGTIRGFKEMGKALREK